VNGHSHFGAFAPHSRLGPYIHGAGPDAGLELRLHESGKKMGIKQPRSEWAGIWAMLMARIFEVLPLICERCGSEMRIVPSVTDADEIRALLEKVGLDADPPTLAPARDPPRVETHMRKRSRAGVVEKLEP
jgi:hypothetical protein